MLAGKPTLRPLAACGNDCEAIALGGAGIAGGSQPGDALCTGLLGHGAEGRPVVGFAAAEAQAEDGRHVVIHGELRGVKDILCVDVDDLGAARDGVGPFDVEVGFHDVVVVARVVADQDLYGVVVRQIELLAEGAEVGEIEGGIADDGDLLAVAIDAGGIERGDVVDGGEVVGHEGVYALAGSVLGADDVGAQLEIVEAEEAADHIFERGGNGGFVHIGEVGFAIHAEAMEARAEGAGRLGGGAAEIDPVAAAGHLVDLEALRFQPGGYFGNVIGGEAEAVAELFGSEPLVVVGRPGKLLLREEGVDCRRPA